MLLFSDSFYNDSENLLDIFCGVFSCGLLVTMEKPCDHCSLLIPTWDDHSTCIKCRDSLLDYVAWIYISPAKSAVVGRLLPGEDLEITL